ncbi:SRPBCC family protein [uncultured Jatrophihabitans sp.]|uniref:SRPBCC family protein n=1 Tax=uncultured Jatrophihabitans sp. TaxID=1610747 RepID=UPI0035CBB4CA
MQYRVDVRLAVPAERAWAQLADLSAWPAWTPTVESLDSATPRPQVGTAVTIKQPGRKPAHYVIDVVEDGRRFRWGSDRGGVRQAADHVVEPDSAVACTVTLTFTMTGPLGRILGLLGAAKIRGMVDTEARALTAVVQPQSTDT